MGKNHSSMLKDINEEFTKDFSFNGRTFLCKILKIISSNRFKVVFVYKKKLLTWNVELIGCNHSNIVNNEYTKKQINDYLTDLFSKNKYFAKIICGQLQNGFIKVVLKLNSEKKTLNDLMIDNGYSLTNINTSNDLLTENIVNINYINNEPVSRIKLINVKPADETHITEFHEDPFYNELNNVLKNKTINSI